MKVKELIEKLQKCDPDTDVEYFPYRGSPHTIEEVKTFDLTHRRYKKVVLLMQKKGMSINE